jgi:hypothetical protein
MEKDFLKIVEIELSFSFFLFNLIL